MRRSTRKHKLSRIARNMNEKCAIFIMLLAIAVVLTLAVSGCKNATGDTVNTSLRDNPDEPLDPVPEPIVIFEKIETRYDLTDAERHAIACVVTCEAMGEPFAGMVAVAQCILQACEDDEIKPLEAVEKYGYSLKPMKPSDDALEAVHAVFDLGQVATKEPIKFFYAPAVVKSDWHESQTYVMTINGHRFFKEAE